MRKLYLLTFLALGFTLRLLAASDIHVIAVNLYKDQLKKHHIGVDTPCLSSGTTIYAEIIVQNKGNTNYSGPLYLYYTGHLKADPEVNPPKWFKLLNSIDNIQIDTQSKANITVSLTVSYLFNGGGGFPHGQNIIIVWPTESVIGNDSTFSNNFNSAFAMCEAPNGINNPEPGKNLFTLYPNPAFDKVLIQTGEHKGATDICIRDLSGKLIMQQHLLSGITSVSLSLDQDGKPLPAGFYLVSVVTESGRQVQKLMVSR